MSGFEKKTEALLKKIQNLKSGKNRLEDFALPENCFFLSDDEVLCEKRTTGDSRYPYGNNGMSLWAYQSGQITLNESTLHVFPPAEEGKQPYAALFGGVKNGDEFIPVALLGSAAAQPNEKNVERYCVFTPQAVYYFTQAQDILFTLRLYVDENKRTCFSVIAKNDSKTPKELYFSTFFNCLLKNTPGDDFESKWYKSCRKFKQGFMFDSVIDLSRTQYINYYGVVKRAQDIKNLINIQSTASRSGYTGSKINSLNCAESLFSGIMKNCADVCKFTETAVAADIVTFNLKAGETARIDYVLSVTTCNDDALAEINKPLDAALIDAQILDAERKTLEKTESEKYLNINFSGIDCENLNENALNLFIKSVIRQVEYCALSKTSGVSLLGVRDVFQQIEAALLWIPGLCRAKILEALSFTGTNGRMPRQYSLPPKEDVVPIMDMRAFIDQGQWIIDTVYSYLSHTGDFTILDEICGYYEYGDNSVNLSFDKGSVLEHIIKIAEYLISNIDGKTGCLKTLYGDWNDALDGLGASKAEGRTFGNGVSVMATCHLYKNLGQLIEIFKKTGQEDKKIVRYETLRKSVKDGLRKNAVLVNNEAKRKIVHGWGDNQSYYAGSYCDPDSKSRDSAASNAFWIISGMLEADPSIKSDILEAYGRLDSKYGIKTFDPHFERGTTGVGRIINLPRGTAENGATYVHATLFAVWSLFLMGEKDEAFKQLYKILPLTHKIISTTPFVMSNSYVYNEEFNMDGESMSDWYTGSANVLLKVLVRFVLGFDSDLGGVTIQPAKDMPFKKAELKIFYKSVPVKIIYHNKTQGNRRFFINGTERKGELNELMDTESLRLNDEEINKPFVIEIID